MFFPPAARVICSCTGATSPSTKAMFAPSTDGRSRCVKTQHGVSPYHPRHLSGFSSRRSWSSTHSYVVRPIAIAPTPAKYDANDWSPSDSRSTSNSQSSELCSSAMKPSSVVAV